MLDHLLNAVASDRAVAVVVVIVSVVSPFGDLLVKALF